MRKWLTLRLSLVGRAAGPSAHAHAQARPEWPICRCRAAQPLVSSLLARLDVFSLRNAERREGGPPPPVKSGASTARRSQRLRCSGTVGIGLAVCRLAHPPSRHASRLPSVLLAAPRAAAIAPLYIPTPRRSSFSFQPTIPLFSASLGVRREVPLRLWVLRLSLCSLLPPARVLRLAAQGSARLSQLELATSAL